ncbi:hypothetical protein KR50_11320 [Jeotgalibacillus campisalis]|uniref:Uncharacterized protein n=1 Tax=Jeotgalibacillus campisalis TaxID=220754 RepID=A0A0C2VJP6_9BACL|nr:hypothetical protein KR50_11320 [Jeotgalibacillus campisalis]
MIDLNNLTDKVTYTLFNSGVFLLFPDFLRKNGLKNKQKLPASIGALAGS